MERLVEYLEWFEENDHVISQKAQAARQEIREVIDRLHFAMEGGEDPASNLRNKVIRALETTGNHVANGTSLYDACITARSLIRHIDNTLGDKLRPQRDMLRAIEPEQETHLRKRLRERERAWQEERSAKLDAMRNEGKSDDERMAFMRQEDWRFRKEQQAIENEEEPHEGWLREAVKAWADHLSKPGSKAPKWEATRTLLVFLFGEDIPDEDGLRKGWEKWCKKRPHMPRP